MKTLRFTLGSLCLLWNTAQAELIGDLDLLDQVQALQVANREKIRTWSGVIQLESRHENEEYRRIVERTDLVWYATDVDQQRSCVRWQTIASREWNPLKRERQTDTFVNCLGGRLVLIDQFYKFEQRFPEERQPRANVSVGIYHPLQLRGDHFAMIDPFDFFKLDSGETPESIFPKRKINSQQEWAFISATRESHFVLHKYGNNNIPGDTSYRFDMNAAGLLTEYYNKNLVSGGKQILEYANINDVYVPQVVFSSSGPPGGFPSSERRLYWLEQQVNEPLDERMFTLEFIGVPAGSRVNDRLGGKQYEFTPDPAVLEYVNALIAKHLPQQDAAPVRVDQPERADREASSGAVEASSEEVQTPVGQKSLSWLLLPPVLLLGVGLGFWMGNRKG